ncbi:hypothetical protein QBC34DRAFT_466807 [Podospora aff. communis PSN243]|uniref:Uncharacterized protein n=1 Tax=Podospora aff. communis PSN243 TaxID=3040156 RepID=A0AAV9GHK7_9PEZI|nr:hypothetical protein QBC34DRAFT_466807 [Podospora aff. communis PSN243]
MPSFQPASWGSPGGTRSYRNGLLPKTPRQRRAVQPTPGKAEEERTANETDCVATEGKFHPGSMVSSRDKDDHYEKYQDNFEEDSSETRRVCKVVQGEPGTTWAG